MPEWVDGAGCGPFVPESGQTRRVGSDRAPPVEVAPRSRRRRRVRFLAAVPSYSSRRSRAPVKTLPPRSWSIGGDFG